MRAARAFFAFALLHVAGCAAGSGLGPPLATRSYYAPESARVILDVSADGRIEESAVPADPAALPLAARTAIERERPGGHVASVHRAEGTRGVVWRVRKVVLGEAVEYEARDDGEILSRAVAIQKDGPAWEAAAAASARLDPGGKIEAMSYLSGPSGKELLVTKIVGGARFRLRLRARGDDWEAAERRRLVEAELRIESPAGSR